MRNAYIGPSLPLSQEIDEMKYRQAGEDYNDKVLRLAKSMSDNESHEDSLLEIFGNMRFLPAGRVQSAMGSARITTAYNCFVSGTIHDSMESVMSKASTGCRNNETWRRNRI